MEAMKSNANSANAITEGPILKQLLIFFFPILLGTFFQQLYNTVDAVVVGQFVGTEALAAVGGTTAAIINLMVGFFVGLSAGASVVISQYYGAQKAEETSQAVHTAIALAIVSGLVLTVAGILISPWALRAMETPENVMAPSLTYIRIFFGGIIFPILYNIGSGILRAVGDSKRPLYFLIVCSLTNVALDLFFVLVFDWGVMGVALATVLAQAVSVVLVFLSLLKTTDTYRLIWKKISFHGKILKQIIIIGLPAGLQSMMYSVSNVLIQSTINSFGSGAMAAWTACGKIDGIFWMIMNAFGISITTFSGQNFGAQKYDRIRKSVRICLVLATATAAAISAVLMVGGPFIYRLFSKDTEVIAQGMEILSVLVPFYFTYVCIEVLSGAVRGAGDSVIPMIMVCVGVCVLRVVWIYTVLPLHRTLGMVILSYPVTWAITSVLFVLYYLQGGWLRRRIRKAGFQAQQA